MSVKVKICGIRTLEAARASVDAGADFLGFNFVKSSKRYIDPVKAKEIISMLLPEIKIVGVFQNEEIKMIKEIVDLLKIDFVQLHGTESARYSRLTQYAGIIKTFLLPFDFDSQKLRGEMEKYNVDYFLLDRGIQGEGTPINTYKVRELSLHFPVFLAGGLNPENVSESIRIAQPYAVDVAGGIETGGEQDIGKIREFIRNAKEEL
ncbi:phosphoribosylanthranilate isomerase [Candidatus Gottesmanbacteria bacterium]|nr:phosphoribosylanthranilate isomerase [Candidatus Gottesmanbacteria bacterium]